MLVYARVGCSRCFPFDVTNSIPAHYGFERMFSLDQIYFPIAKIQRAVSSMQTPQMMATGGRDSMPGSSRVTWTELTVSETTFNQPFMALPFHLLLH